MWLLQLVLDLSYIIIICHLAKRSKEEVQWWSARWWECGNVDVGEGVSGGLNLDMILLSLLLMTTTHLIYHASNL